MENDSQFEKRRLELHHILENILESDKVYFQPPMSIELEYPCIIYSRASGRSRFADNKALWVTYKYTITVVSRDPDCPVVDKLAKEVQWCSYDRHYVANNLHHDVFDVFY